MLQLFDNTPSGRFILHWVGEMLYQVYVETDGVAAEMYIKWRDRKISASKIAVLPALSSRHLGYEVYDPESKRDGANTIRDYRTDGGSTCV